MSYLMYHGVRRFCSSTSLFTSWKRFSLQQISPCVTSLGIKRSYRVSRYHQYTAGCPSPSCLITPEGIIKSPIKDIELPDKSLHETMFERFDEFGERVALEEFITKKSCTYSQLKESAIKVASGLTRKGYCKGDVIIGFSYNCINYSVVMLACASIGVWFSSANNSFTAGELSRQISQCNAKAIFTTPEQAVISADAVASSGISGVCTDIFVFGDSSFEMLLEDDGKAFPDVDINAKDDVFVLPYSSGTTGFPKGVMLTHYSVLANVHQLQATLPVDAEDVVLGLLPFFHVFGMLVIQYCSLYAGAKTVILPKFEPETFLLCLQDKKVTFGHLVPPLILFLAKHPMASQYDLTSLRRILCGAAPLGTQLINEFLERHSHGVQLNQAYGLTETSPVTNVDIEFHPSSVGIMVANTFGKVIDLETKKILGPGEEGEFCIKGPQVMKGYYKNQEATDEMVTPDGWLHTGDIGYYTKDGLVYIKERIKELIKYKGNQVAPAELEALLLGHPDILDVAVTGVPDESAGELPKAFVVKKPNSGVTQEDIVNFVLERVAPHKRLRGGVEFIPEVPKNPSGKILRRMLRNRK